MDVSRRVRLIIASTLAFSVTAAIATILFSGTGGDQADAGTTPPAPAATYPASATLDSATVAGMNATGVHFTPVSPNQLAAANLPTQIRNSDAINIAASQFSFLNEPGGQVDSAILGYLTDPAVNNGSAQPRLVWLVTFKGFTSPILGGDPITNQKLEHDYAGNSHMWVALDPVTGTFLGANSIPNPAAMKAQPPVPNYKQ